MTGDTTPVGWYVACVFMDKHDSDLDSAMFDDRARAVEFLHGCLDVPAPLMHWYLVRRDDDGSDYVEAPHYARGAPSWK